MTGSSVYRQSAEGTLSRLCTLSLVERQVVRPAVRSCKEAFPNGKVRKSPRMSPIFDLKSKGLRALRHLPGFVDGLRNAVTSGLRSSKHRQSAEGTLSRYRTHSLVDRPSLSELSAGIRLRFATEPLLLRSNSTLWSRFVRQMQAFALTSRRTRLPPPGRSFV